MNAGNMPYDMPLSESHDDGFVSPAMTLMCVSCGNDYWMHHIFNEKGHRPNQVRRCTECKGKKGRWVTQKEKEKINDARFKEEQDAEFGVVFNEA